MNDILKISDSTNAAVVPATIVYSNCPVPNGLIVAGRASGPLPQAGIDLQLLSGQQGTLHFTYDHPAYTRFGGEIPPLLSESLRAPGRTRLLGLSLLKVLQGLYVKRDSPLRTAADLKGRKVGVSGAATRILRNALGDYRELDPWRQTLIALGTLEARGLLHTLEAGGLALADVELVRIHAPWVDVPDEQLDQAASLRGSDLFLKVAEAQATLLEQGHVDALCSFGPWAAELEDNFFARSLFDLSVDRRNHFVSTWTVSSDLVERAPDVVQRLVDAVVEQALWAANHGEAVTNIHAENLGVSGSAVLRGFGPDFYRDLLPSLDENHLAVLGQTQDFLLAHRLIDQPVDFSRWAAPEFLARSVERIQPSIQPSRSIA